MLELLRNSYGTFPNHTQTTKQLSCTDMVVINFSCYTLFTRASVCINTIPQEAVCH